MRREIKLIILVFVLVVGPAIALSFLAARVLESWQIVLQKRMAGEAGHVLDEAVAAWDHELASLRAVPDLSGKTDKTTYAWGAQAAGLTLQHPWVEGCFVFQAGGRLLYPAAESLSGRSDFKASNPEMEALLRAGGSHLAKGETNAAVNCLGKVAGVDGGHHSGGALFRDQDEGFFYDLIALRRLSEIFAAQGRGVRVAEIRAIALERVLARYNDLVPLQRESMVEWIGTSVKQAQWRERMRGRALGQAERAGLEGSIRMMESTLPDSGWITLRMNQAHGLVTKLQPLDAPALILALQYNESGLIGHLNALFAITASNTEIRVRCQAGEEPQAGPVLSSRQLSSPFEAISLEAIPRDAPAFLANARLQMRLYRGGGVLLLISVVAGVWLLWREAAGEIRQARERSDFAATVSHDLRTPLSSMRMLAESLYMGNVTDEGKRKKFLGAIIKESDRLSRLTDRALYFIRYGQGALRYQFTEGDLGGVVRETVETFAVGAGSGVKVTMEISPHLPAVKFDAGAMEQVVYNLLDNAVKYSHRSSRDGVVPIEVRLAEEAGKIVFSVQDHGVGMTPEEMKRVLKPYVRGKHAGHQNARGIGLGLALCQHVVQAHGGRIQIQSEPGKGSKFSILLPG